MRSYVPKLNTKLLAGLRTQTGHQTGLPSICPNLQNVCVSNCKIYLSQIAKCVCLNLQNIFVSFFKMYLSQIAQYIFLNLQNVFVSRFTPAA